MMKPLKKYSTLEKNEIALLSIHPEHAEKILSGEKKLEFRRVWAKKEVSIILIYVTVPIKKIVGYARVKQVHFGDIDFLWSIAEDIGGGLSRVRLEEYFSGKDNGYAIEMASVCRFPEPVEPKDIFENFKPPQSFFYVSKFAWENLENNLRIKKKIFGKFIIFVAGVHGVGKTTLCQYYVEKSKFIHKSSGQLINEARNKKLEVSKVVEDIDGNQKLLLLKIKNLLNENSKLLLDGHFAVLDKNDRPLAIDTSIFSQMGISAIIVIVGDSREIIEKIKDRDGQSISLESISELQSLEVSRALEVSKAMSIPLVSVKAYDKKDFTKKINYLISKIEQ